MAVVAMLQNHGILEGNQMFLLDGDQLTPHILGFIHLGEPDHNEIRHATETLGLTSFAKRLRRRQSRRRLERGNDRLGAEV